MRKILKAMLSAVIVCVTAVTVSLCAYAETEDVELPVTTAKTTNGAWGQSLTYPPNIFDCTRMTPDTIVKVEFELDGEWTGNGAPVELVLQNYSVDPQIWAKTEPFEYDETSASFKYEDMVAVYGSDDFSGIGNLCLGDCGIVMKATKFTVTNCTVRDSGKFRQRRRTDTAYTNYNRRSSNCGNSGSDHNHQEKQKGFLLIWNVPKKITVLRRKRSTVFLISVYL